MNKKLIKALVIGQNYKARIDGEELVVEDKENRCAAVLDGDGHKIYVTGCYNSGVDWIELDIKKLQELEEFIKFMAEDEDDKPKITAKMVKNMREWTGAGMMECKQALIESNGDVFEAMDKIRVKGLC